MTYIPRKNEYQNNQEAKLEASNRVDSKPKIDWFDIMVESHFIDAIFKMVFITACWLHILTIGTDSWLHEFDWLKYTCDVIVLGVFGLLILNYFLEKRITGFLIDVIHFIGSFGKPLSAEQTRELLIQMEESREKDIKNYNDRVEQSKKDYGYYESLKKSEDTRDFNTRQKHERRARAYAKADPEFEVSFKSKAGCWVRDIVRGRDKAEVLSRMKFDPRVEYVGAVVGIDE